MEFNLDIERLLEELKEEEEPWVARLAEMPNPIAELPPVARRPKFGFGRQCGWCNKYLRAWQTGFCQMCALSSSPPCRRDSMTRAPADSWRFKKTLERLEAWKR